MIDLLDELDQLEARLAEWGEPRYRAAQLRGYLLKSVPFSHMLTLPKALRARLEAEAAANGAPIQAAYPAADGQTEKYLYALRDGQTVEGVRMRYHHGDTLCLSTQAGCRMGCRFCASTLEGLARSLTAGEMLGQFLSANARAPLHNAVLMGSGEPLDNYEATVRFLRLLSDPALLNISPRRVSLSTCGLVPQMRRFTDENLAVTLCVSLHAPDDARRAEIMPVAAGNPIRDVLAAADGYAEKTGRRVIIEYTLIGGFNDAPGDARALAALLRGRLCHVNLITLSPVPERGLAPSAEPAAAQFLSILVRSGVSATRRRALGADVGGACGQLRRARLDIP